jgi:flagellar motor protein MotB
MSSNNLQSDFWADLEAPGESHSRLVWFMTFADLVCLLLAFFVLMFAMKDLDQSKFKDLSSGFKGAFSSKQGVVARYAEEMRASESEVKVRNKDVLEYLDALVKTRLQADPVWSKLTSARTPFGELAYALPMENLITQQEDTPTLSPEGLPSLTRLASMLRNWDNVVVLRAVAPDMETGAKLLQQATAIQAHLISRGALVLRQAEWRQPVAPINGKEQLGQQTGVYLVVQGAK